ncbi:isocitrate lyase/PEP mutase family protein [Rhodococcus sp. HM1]|uniref:isocitrate lyase/PEP mutase family protein n=1 Tax=Rhodococcus sp. HM1 TaxID=2937759 RepID=UPI00200A8415|nr:isocitrate lyase/PEP mutase family protein [Rhodococcus sp. HM1]MCK8671556.1 isocitrate lyase/PEP mutase family protein [Rhodococcus sp. HM1]
MNRSTTTSPARTLRHLLATDELITAPGVYDGISASAVRALRFSAAYMTGAGVAASGFGLPDIGLTSLAEMVDRARMLATTLGEIPLIADADTGYGNVVNVTRTIREYEQAGVAAIQLEDQAFPKKCGHLPDKELITADEFCDRLAAALEARTDPDLVIIARTDARGPLGLDEAITRANRYAEAGADVIFVEAPRSHEEIARIATEVSAPLLLNVVIGGLTPSVDESTLRALGYRLAIHPTTPLLAATTAMQKELQKLGGARGIADDAGTSPTAFFELVGLREWAQIGEKFRVSNLGEQP